MKVDITHECDVEITPRVLQMAGMFDVPLESKTKIRIETTLPIEERPWNIGLIVGPSGSGKSSIAKHLWPNNIVGNQEWSRNRSLLDDFPPTLGIKETVGLLTSVGLGSPPSWVRPYRTLSNGEAFRASMARALADADDDIVVIDEFTSVVDRQTARVTSNAIQKAVRRTNGQLIAVSCHYDIEDWLQPDWIYDTSTRAFKWRLVQPRPAIKLDIYPTDLTPWPMFRNHHYLSGKIVSNSICFGGWIGKQLVAFAAVRHFPHAKTRNIKMIHRIVVLPDYQGIGIGGKFSDWLGQHFWDKKFRCRIVLSHPALAAHFTGSPRWKENAMSKKLYSSSRYDDRLAKSQIDPRSLGLRSFEYRAPK